jgi:hypothetical protein
MANGMGGRGSTRAAILVPTSRDGDGAGRARARGGVVGDLVFFLNHETQETHEKKIVWLRFVWEGEVPPEPQTWSPRAATVTERDEHEHEVGRSGASFGVQLTGVSFGTSDALRGHSVVRRNTRNLLILVAGIVLQVLCVFSPAFRLFRPPSSAASRKPSCHTVFFRARPLRSVPAAAADNDSTLPASVWRDR